MSDQTAASPAERLLRGVLDQHRLVARTRCGAISIPVVHHHGTESEAHPGPKRSLTCSEWAGHDGPHRDAICCYRFQTFEDWQVTQRQPSAYAACTCGTVWPCPTIEAIQEAAGAEEEH